MRCLLLCVIACSEPRLPTPSVLSTGVLAAVTAPDGAYWIESRGRYRSSLVHWSSATGSVTEVDQREFIELPHRIFVSDDTILWGSNGGFESGHQTRIVVGGEARDLEIPDSFAGNEHPAFVNLREGRLDYVGLDRTYEHSVLRTLDLESARSEDVVVLDVRLDVGEVAVVDGTVYGVGFGRSLDLYRIDRGVEKLAPLASSQLATDGEHLIWTVNPEPGLPTTIHQLSGSRIETLANLGETRFYAPVWRDGLWGLADEHPARLEADGTLTVFPSAYHARALTSVGDAGLLALTAGNDLAPSTLLLQPLD